MHNNNDRNYVLIGAFLAALCLAAMGIQAAPTASEEVRQRLVDALRGQIKQFITASVNRRSPPTGAPTEERIKQETDILLQQALVRLGPEFTLSHEVARRLFTSGPDDTDNAAALKRNWEIYKEISGKLPVLIKHLHEQFDAGTITGGWDLEVARRVSDSVLSEAKDAQRRHKEAQKKKP